MSKTTSRKMPSLAFILLSVVLLFATADGFRPRSTSRVASFRQANSNPMNGEGISTTTTNTKLTSRHQQTCLQLRGGGVPGVLVALIRTAMKNPILIFLMASSTLVVKFKEDIPYSKHLQSCLQMCVAGYVFYLLVSWQQMHEEAAAES